MTHFNQNQFIHTTLLAEIIVDYKEIRKELPYFEMSAHTPKSGSGKPPCWRPKNIKNAQACRSYVCAATLISSAINLFQGALILYLILIFADYLGATCSKIWHWKCY